MRSQVPTSDCGELDPPDYSDLWRLLNGTSQRYQIKPLEEARFEAEARADSRNLRVADKGAPGRLMWRRIKQTQIHS